MGAAASLLVGSLCVLTEGMLVMEGLLSSWGKKVCDLPPGVLVSHCYRFSVPRCLMLVICSLKNFALPSGCYLIFILKTLLLCYMSSVGFQRL